jgi:hypothetical protein
MYFFTSITSNYIPKARVLARSVKTHNPDAVFYLMLADRLPENVNLADEPFDSVFFMEDLGIIGLDAWIFRHSLVELCTAVKGITFLKIFQTTEADKIVYLDPDILVLHSLKELSEILDRHDIVLTPHQVEPEKTMDAIVDNEICSLKHGVFNLGFLAIRRSDEGMRFLKWWADRLMKFCCDDIANGLFTDQRWVDLAPAFFTVYVLRDKTYNVATWNLSHRDVRSGMKDRLEINGMPVKFFHFSGFDSGDQEIMLKKYAHGNKGLFRLREWYIKALERAGQDELGGLPCIYNYYSNGELITSDARRLYRSRMDLMEAFSTPSVVSEDKNCYYWWFKEHGTGENHMAHRYLTEGDRVLLKMKDSYLWKVARKSRQLKKIIKKLVGVPG